MSSDVPSVPPPLIIRKNKYKNKNISNNHSMLNHVIRTGNIKEVKLLLKKRVDVNKPGRNTWTPLHMAAWGGHHKIIKILIKNSATVNSTLSFSSTRYGWTPLHLAVRKNQIKCAKVLLENGASVDSIDYDVCHPLQIAVMNGSVKMAALLLEHGADINIRFDQKDEFLKLFKSNTTRAIFLAERKLPLLHFSILQNLNKMTKLLLNRGADIYLKTAKDETTLMQAVRVNDLKLVRLLLAKDANPNDCDAYGMSVLFSVLFNINTLISRYCKEEYSKMDIKLKMVRYLVRAGANVNAPLSINTNNGLDNYSFLFCAAKRGYYSIVEFLLYRSDFNFNAITLNSVRSIKMRHNLITPDIIGDPNYIRSVYVNIRHTVCQILEYTVSRYVFGLPICERLLHALISNRQVSPFFDVQTQSRILKDLIDKYSSMIDHMKQTTIGDTNITYWHVSTCENNELIKLTAHKEIMKLYIPYCISNFNPYSYMLKQRVNNFYKRRLWVEKLTEVMFKFYNNDLPYDCCEKIANYFNYKELKAIFYFEDKNIL